MKALLLHICCAPCSIYSWEHFCRLGYNTRGYFFNPNIHPYREFSRRLETLYEFSLKKNREVIFNREYHLEEFLQTVVEAKNKRCHSCYEIRLFETARKAAELEIDCFSTTLLISPYQDHIALKETGEKAARRYGISFVYADLRSGFTRSMQEARTEKMYRQGYCGCIFSEKERYCRNDGEKLADNS